MTDCKLTVKFRDGKKRKQKTVNLTQEQATQFLELIARKIEE